MQKCIAVIIVAQLLGAWAPIADAESKTVTGEVVSLSCYFSNKKNVGKAGLLCALATVKYEGNPVGIVAADGSVYQLEGGLTANNNAKSVPLLSHTVTVTGDVTEKAGMMMLKADDATIVQ